MTDYKQYSRPQLPRPLPPIQFEKIMIMVFIVFILVALSMAGREDMRVQAEIDKHQLLHDTRRAVIADEMAAL